MTAETKVDSEVLQDLTARFESDPDWIPAAAREITDAIHAELPELEVDDEIRLSTYASTLSVLQLMTDMLRLRRPASEAEPPPAAVDYAREFVRRGVTIDTLLRAYHVGHATYFRNWVMRVHNELADLDQRARAVELEANWTFEYVQALSRELVARYAEERDAWVRSAAAIRTETRCDPHRNSKRAAGR